MKIKANKTAIKCTGDNYKVSQLRKMLNDIDYDNNPNWSHAILKSGSSKGIILDAGAINLLIDYYTNVYEPVDASTNRRAIKANTSSFRTEFQSFLDRVDRQVSDALYQYDDAMWDVKGTMAPGDHSYWCELNLYCDGEEAGTVNIECTEESGTKVRTDALVVTVSDSDTIQSYGNSFDDIYNECVGELIRLAEDYVNFVRIKY
ncbi:hypothetical protein [Ruminococcus sp.]|uniref:hypothetical protein n=1 Tax=Ruminococcus sp. TaxID=41978 RepID=UPI001B66DF82|nr:hypothetical protein [Ruminococcus sp.]MBP5433694.1 hypothetical protein [Ruminococcus sp.]